MGERVSVVFTDGHSFSNCYVSVHNGGNVLGITIEEIWNRLKESTLDQCCQVIKDRDDELMNKWRFRPTAKITPISGMEAKDLYRLDHGDSGVIVVDVNRGTVDNLQDGVWSRRCSISEYAKHCRKMIGVVEVRS